MPEHTHVWVYIYMCLPPFAHQFKAGTVSLLQTARAHSVLGMTEMPISCCGRQPETPYFLVLPFFLSSGKYFLSV